MDIQCKGETSFKLNALHKTGKYRLADEERGTEASGSEHKEGERLFKAPSALRLLNDP